MAVGATEYGDAVSPSPIRMAPILTESQHQARLTQALRSVGRAGPNSTHRREPHLTSLPNVLKLQTSSPPSKLITWLQTMEAKMFLRSLWPAANRGNASPPNPPVCRGAFALCRCGLHCNKDASSQAPAATHAMPAARAIHRPAGVNFSTRTSSDNSAIQSTFITPTTNNSAIKTQQQPTQ